MQPRLGRGWPWPVRQGHYPRERTARRSRRTPSARSRPVERGACHLQDPGYSGFLACRVRNTEMRVRPTWIVRPVTDMSNDPPTVDHFSNRNRPIFQVCVEIGNPGRAAEVDVPTEDVTIDHSLFGIMPGQVANDQVVLYRVDRGSAGCHEIQRPVPLQTRSLLQVTR